MQIVDRRLNPGGKSLENRQKFLRRAKALMQRAVKKSSETKDIRDVLEGGEVEIPLDGLNEPSFQRGSRSRDMVLPGNKQFSEGDHIPRPPEEGGGRPSGPGEGDSEKKHVDFVERMVTRGYTERQVRRLVEWYMRVKQAS